MTAKKKDPTPDTTETPEEMSRALQVKVARSGDLAKLTTQEQDALIVNICDTLGLNPALNPVNLMSFKGKLVAYINKGGAEQIRANMHLSAEVVSEGFVEDELWKVRVKLTNPAGAHSIGTGIMDLHGLKGQDRANKMLHTESKALRRGTLAFAGAAWLENEPDELPGAEPVQVNERKAAPAGYHGNANKPDTPEEAVVLITEKQAIEIVEACGQNDVDLDMIINTLGLVKIEDLPAAEFASLQTRIAGYIERRDTAKAEKATTGENGDDGREY